MGNVLRALYGQCCKPTADSDASGYHGVTAATVGVSALAQDLYNFEITSQVPQGLSQHVVSSKKAQANWYRKLSEAWRETKPPPKTPEEASRLIVLTLKRRQHADVEGFLTFYGLPLPHILVELTSVTPPSRPEGLKFELYTLPVDIRAVGDGDGMTVYVSTTDSRESAIVPGEVQVAAVKRSQARAQKNYDKAEKLHKKIIDLGYRVILLQNQEVLARKYRIRLRGIDAPECQMDYGQEAKEELANIVQGKCLRALVFDEDRYGRCVADVYCNGIFLQESMLKKGLAWHYKAYDQRPEFDEISVTFPTLMKSNLVTRRKRPWKFPAKMVGLFGHRLPPELATLSRARRQAEPSEAKFGITSKLKQNQVRTTLLPCVKFVKIDILTKRVVVPVVPEL